MSDRTMGQAFVMASCALESGVLAAGLVAGLPLHSLALLMAAAQGGYILVDLRVGEGWSERRWAALAFVSAFALVFAGSPAAWPLAMPAALAYSMATQTLRRARAVSAPLALQDKALFRYVGYLLGGLAALSGGIPLALLAAPAALAYAGASREKPARAVYAYRVRGARSLLWFVFLHHAQYFVFVYAFLHAACLGLGVPPVLVGGLILMGWAGYTLVELAALNLRLPGRSTILIGHVLNGVALAGMARYLLREDLSASVAMWVLTGVFGGTAYLHTQLRTRAVADTTGTRNMAEHAGHILGPCLCAILSGLGGDSLTPFWVGAVLSLLSAVAAARITLDEEAGPCPRP